MTEPNTFKVSWSDHEVKIEGRQAAVDFAKSKSVEVAPQNVAVESMGDEKTSTISMTYNGGHLEVYVAETRSPERRSRKRDRAEDDAVEATEGGEEETTEEASTSDDASEDAVEEV